jgi:IMP dehydrogenase
LIFQGGFVKEALSFDDVLLVPKYSEVKSRRTPDLTSKLSDELIFDLPVISSPMDTITESEMASSMATHGGLGVIHRYNTVAEQVELTKNCKGTRAAAIGVSGDFEERALAAYDAGAKILCVDIAHGHHVLMKNALTRLREIFGGSVHIMAGNVATLEGFNDLASWGANSIRVGIGGGSICSTRLVSGHGVPTFQSILECSRTEYDVKIIADGGIKTTGDIVKALAAGADFAMVGSMLAGTKETPGEVFVGSKGKQYKVYRGMASSAAQKEWRGRSSTPEGVSTTIPFKGTINTVLDEIRGGLCSGLSYSGALNLVEFRSRAEFIKQTKAGQKESFTHILRRNK